MVHVVLLAVCAVAIYVACEWFVNAVEWLGARLQVGPVAVGSILAAVGTALPESVVTLVAVLFGPRSSGADIAMGAALGGPLVVGTLAYGVTGAMLLWRRRMSPVPPPARRRSAGEGGDSADEPSAGGGDFAGVDSTRLARDQRWFLVIFVVKVALGLVAFAGKSWLGFAFFAAYGVYFWREMRPDAEPASETGLEPLRLLRRRKVPPTWAVLLQVLATLAVIFVASQVFVAQLDWAGPALGLTAVVVALLLAPVATELPEILNAVIWVRQGKTQLSLANLSGSMMIQATIPSGIGLLGTPWRFDTPLVLAGIVTLSAVAFLERQFNSGKITATRLSLVACFYVAFAAALAVYLW